MAYGDNISRQAAIEAVNSLTYPSSLMDVKRKLMELPPAEPERKKGKWTNENACEFCGFQPWYERDINTLSFCPNCGAKMV